MSNTFFNELQEHSLIKSDIVTKYFAAWSNVMVGTFNRRKNQQKALGYIDLYAGPGKDETGQYSTPIKIIEHSIANPKLHSIIRFVLNDKNPKHVAQLEDNIKNLPGIENLDNYPQVSNIDISNKTADHFNKTSLIPCFSFIDPFGYKGLSKKLISSLVKDWGCDCIFFFNYNRINAAITNSKVFELINDIFSDEIANHLRGTVHSFCPEDRENYIIETLANSFKSEGRYVLPFRFQSPKRKSTSHYLIFVTKHELGYRLMKDIMARESSNSIHGVASFSYIPTHNQQLSLLYSLSSPLDSLKDMLLTRFKGKTLSVEHIYQLSHVDTPYTLRNYKDVLIELEINNTITGRPPHTERRPYKGKPSMNEKILISFP